MGFWVNVSSLSCLYNFIKSFLSCLYNMLRCDELALWARNLIIALFGLGE
jgi:hypothetical protein